MDVKEKLENNISRLGTRAASDYAFTITCDEAIEIMKLLDRDVSFEDDDEIGKSVQKKTGYKFPGKIVSVFKTLSGKKRYVVECTVPEVSGILHIYNPEQLEFI
jgi:hypothetical protein